MANLGDYITVQRRFARSTNVERDADRPEPLGGYVVTRRALDVIERIASTAREGRGGAWSVTGPYGSGKSSLALLLDAAFGPAGSARGIACELIKKASPSAGEMIHQIHQRHRTQESGFHRGVVTANREPLAQTLLRALQIAVLRTYGRIPRSSQFQAAAALRGALKDMMPLDARRTGPSPATIIEIAQCLAKSAPLLLVIDEFGKNLEAIQDGDDSDPYLLQQLAEAGQGSALPIFFLTLQHLSYEDYLGHSDAPKRREWAKVQGRFEDIAYTESAGQTRALIGSVFDVNNAKLKSKIASWSKPLAKQMRSLGIVDLADPHVVAACYPLHPMVAAILPELCSRYGQHERTLFSFLTSAEPSSVSSFLASAKLSKHRPLPCHGIEAVYDYFVDSGALGGFSAGSWGRWIEIAKRLRDAHGLSSQEMRLAKAIAVLNLVSTTGTIRASTSVLELVGTQVDGTLRALESLGLVTYRAFSDEYRIWQGTDVDIRRLLDVAYQEVKRQPLLDVLVGTEDPSPIVAARHSAQNEVLRVFARRYVFGNEAIEHMPPFSDYDGEVLLVVGKDGLGPKLAKTAEQTSGAKPIVAAIPEDLTALDQASREVASILAVLSDETVRTDWVARSELSERLATARVAFDQAINTTFSAQRCRWVLLNGPERRELSGGRGSAALSKAADIVYSSTPIVRNEMLNRINLTSQGAKARRILLEAMIECGSKLGLGLRGYGPEVAMYRAVLLNTGLHHVDSRNDTMTFRRPRETSLQKAWDLVQGEFRKATARRIRLTQIYASLHSPPIGMKTSVIPVFVTAALLAHSEEIAIYEHGTFKPILTSEVSERMVRNPGHFDLKHFANTTGARRKVVETLARHLQLRPAFRKHRVANVLSVVGYLVGRVRRLNAYTRHTSNLSESAREVRNALASAVEPDELLFSQLPNDLGLPTVPADAADYDAADRYAYSLAEALEELSGCYDKLLAALLQFLLDASGEPSRQAIGRDALALPIDALDSTVRPFVLALANESMTSDADWIKAIATVVAGKAPSEWTDSDLLQFKLTLQQQMSTFQRIVGLHARHRSDGDGESASLRVLVTRPDGHEHVGLVSIDQNERQTADDALDSLLNKLTEVFGSQIRAHNAVLALLGERLGQASAGRKGTARDELPYQGVEHG